MNALVLLAQAPDDAAAGGAAVAGGLLGAMAIVWILGIIATIFWAWMLIDVIVSRMETNEKILWFLVVFFLHLIGALIYFFVGRRGRATSAAPA